MKNLAKIMMTSTLIGILGLSGVARAMPINQHSPTNQPAQSSGSNGDMKGAQDITDPANDQDSEVNDERVPVFLSKVGESGETVYDAAKVGDWTKATAHLTSLRVATQQLRTETKSVKTAQLDKSIAALNKAIAIKNRQATMREANQVTLIVAKLTRQFEPKVPVEITLLDYYGRELEIWSAEGNIAKLQVTASNLHQTWEAVRPSVQNYGGQTQAKAFDTLVTRVESAKSPNDYSRLATSVLDKVDRLEQVFK
jgi:hypothetical protein